MLWGCCLGLTYGEWYGVCGFVVLSVVEVCVEYGGVNAFHVCLDFGRLWCWGLYQCLWCSVVCVCGVL